jgi:hypothetical protein
MNANEYTVRLSDLLRRERDSMAEFLAELAEFDRLGFWSTLGYRNLFDYLHRELGLSAGAAHYRKVAADLVRRFPEVLEALRDGRICITSVVALSKVITPENRNQVLPRFFHASKREAQAIAAEIRPTEVVPVRDVVTAVTTAPVGATRTAAAEPNRALALRAASAIDARRYAIQPVEKSVTEGVSAGPEDRDPPPDGLFTVPEFRRDESPDGPAPSLTPRAERADIEHLTGELARLHVTVPKRVLDKLDRARDALAHSKPGATTAEILEAALDLVLDRAAKRRGLVAKPQTNLRSASPDRVRASVRRQVWERDGGRCQYRLPNGEICGATEGLELHHKNPRARGGGHTADDLVLHCKPHHRVVTREDFGDDWIEGCIRRRRNARPRNARRAPRGGTGDSSAGASSSGSP